MSPTELRSGGVPPGEPLSFEELKGRLSALFRALRSEPGFEHTSVIVPSLSVNQEELAKVQGAPFYEERLLFSLIRLRNPHARVIYLTSQPIHPDTIDYYLQLLVGVPASHARRRLMLLCMQDASPRALTRKILDRPRVLARLKGWIGDPRRAYLTCYNSTVLERELAERLQIPLNAVDPDLLPLGTKSGSRRVFREAGVDLPEGFEDLRSRTEVVEALVRLRRRRPGLGRAVVKLNESFSGEGNALFTYPTPFPEDDLDAAGAMVASALEGLAWSHAEEALDSFLRKLGEMGGIVEEFVEAPELRSPSAQMRVRPDGTPELVSTHDQVLGGSTGQVYLGCRFPADRAYRTLIQSEAVKIGRILAERGVVGRFGIDFLAFPDATGAWRCQAVEINLRMGGTTPPFLALEFLVRGGMKHEDGVFVTADGEERYYYATDNLKSPAYRGLLPEDLMDIVARNGVRFDPASETGILFYMIGALSQYGKLGVVSIGSSREEADRIYRHAVGILDRETGAREAGDPEAHLHPLFEHELSLE